MADVTYERPPLGTDRSIVARTAEHGAEPGRATVVCGVDERSSAREVLAVAGMLAHRLSARLVLAHVAVDPHVPGSAVVPGAARELREVELSRAHALLDLRRQLVEEDVLVDSRVLFGDPADELRSLAAAEGADLIVVGCRRRGPLATVLLGGVSSQLARTAVCPVVVVPEPLPVGHGGRSPGDLHGSPDGEPLYLRR